MEACPPSSVADGRWKVIAWEAGCQIGSSGGNFEICPLGQFAFARRSIDETPTAIGPYSVPVGQSGWTVDEDVVEPDVSVARMNGTDATHCCRFAADPGRAKVAARKANPAAFADADKRQALRRWRPTS